MKTQIINWLLSRLDDDETVDAAIKVMEHRMPGRDYITSPQIARNYLKLKMAPLEYEVFYCVFLDVQNGVIDIRQMFNGTINQTSVYPREIAKTALLLNAGAVIIAHNHPSGANQPSTADLTLTQKVKDVLETVDIKLLDHILITAANPPLSFAENGFL